MHNYNTLLFEITKQLKYQLFSHLSMSGKLSESVAVKIASLNFALDLFCQFKLVKLKAIRTNN